MSDIVERLRGIYRIPITDGLGPAGGEEPENPNEFVRTFDAAFIPPIQAEAADEIDALLSKLAKADAELSEARAKLFPYADATEISGMSWNGFYLIGDKKSIREVKRLENRSSQLEVYTKAYNDRIAASEAMCADLAKALEPLKAGIDASDWHDIDGEEMKRILVTDSAIARIDAALASYRKDGK